MVVASTARRSRPSRRRSRVDGPVDGEHLHQQLDAAASYAGGRLERGHAHGRLAAHARRSTARSLVGLGDARGGEPLPQPLVGLRGQQHHDRGVERTTGAADLLVVVDRRGGRADVEAEREIRLVVAHAQRRRRDDGLDLVGAQRGLDARAVGRLGPARCTPRPRARATARNAVEPLGVGDRQAVDDARARQRAQRLVDPRVPLERRTGPASTPRCSDSRASRPRCTNVPAPSCAGDVGRHPRVGGRRGGEHREIGVRQQQRGDPLVVGPEVVAPRGDAVRLVDDEQPEPRQQRLEHAGGEPRVGEPLRATRAARRPRRPARRARSRTSRRGSRSSSWPPAARRAAPPRPGRP